MLTVAGYTVKDTLQVSMNSVVYRAQDDESQRPVVLKVLNKSYPTPLELARFRREYEMTAAFRSPRIIQTVALEAHQHSLVMVLEDFGGVSLREWPQKQTRTLAEKLTVALEITQALGAVHEQGLIHKDLNPSNVVINPATDMVKLIDFGLATALAREEASAHHPEGLEGTLAYLAPEQTGRMNRGVDARSDFYSLGATLYELFTGQPPFSASDPLELVHAHLARQPVPPHELNPAVPPVLSQIVLKLLAKEARARYQSAYGLAADLTEVLRQLREGGAVQPFALGQQDRSARFRLPQTLYGREAEIAALLAAFERVSAGVPELLLVAGYAGIGKTALVGELHKPLTGRRGYFISGKFDQLQRVPYSALIQAFRDLVRQLLTESEAQLTRWRERLAAALGASGQVIIEVIPEVERLIGPQPPLVEVGPQESQNRFQLMFQNFAGVFTQPEHPLVLFLDDLQWADSASLKLLELFLTDSEQRALLVLGAYRDSEVDAAHPLSLLLRDLAKESVRQTTLTLTPLTQAHVTQFVVDTLHITSEEAAPLAEIVFAKTGGNPFFVGEFLRALHQEKLLSFEAEHGDWQWELRQIQARDITDNVVTLMQEKVQQLPAATQVLLEVAACLGGQVALATLVRVQETGAAEVARSLWPALEAGLLIPLGEGYRLLQASDQEGATRLVEEMAISYRFAHDRVQQAAYELLTSEERTVLHHRIGRLLLQGSSAAEREERLFEIVDHLNAGMALVTAPTERDELARLNLRAGQKARAATAYEGASRYLRAGMTLLPSQPWQVDYALTLALHLAATESAYLQGDFPRMEALATEVLAHARTLLDRVKIYEIQLQAHFAQQQILEAVALARDILAQLGVKLPSRPTTLHVLLGLVQSRWLLRGKSYQALAELPPMQDPLALAALRLMGAILSAAYLTTPLLFPLLVFQLLRLTIQGGSSFYTGTAYVIYGMILCVVGEIEQGFAFGQLGLRLGEGTRHSEDAPRRLYGFNLGILHWRWHNREKLPLYLEGYLRGLEMGDLEYASHHLREHALTLFWSSHPLPLVAEEFTKVSAGIRRLKQSTDLLYAQSIHQAVLNLSQPSDQPWLLVGEAFDEQEHIPLLRQMQARAYLSLLYLNKLMIGYLMGAYARAISYAEKAESDLETIQGTGFECAHHFYQSLALLAHSSAVAASEQRRYLKKVAANQKKMKKWAGHAPMNYQHQYELVEAERARLRGDHGAAMGHYEAAIALAHEHEYFQDEALANELAGRYYLGRGMARVAQTYLLDARQGYVTWGALPKVEQLEAQYPTLLSAVTTQLAPGRTTGIVSTSRDSTGGGPQLDLATVVKASQAISSEIDLDRLLGQLLHTVMENAGAEKGALLLNHAGQLRVEAEGTLQPPQIAVMQSIPLEESQSLSPAIIRYIERSQEDVVLDDATQAERFASDAYLQQAQPRSVLATPLLHQGHLLGVLYLENNLTAGAFTPARVEMVRLLGTQAAISISNAQAIASRAEQERLRLEKALLEQRAQDLAELNASKDKFFSIISHDLRSPFNGLLGLSHLMQKYAPTFSQAEVEEYAGRIHNSGKQVLALLDNLLHWAQMQTGRMAFEPGTLNLHELAARNISLLSGTATSKEIRLVSEVGEGLMVYADPHMLDTVVRNLLSNALKFTPGGGQITLSAVAQAGQVEVAVADTGVGMSEATMQKLFRIDVTHTTKGTAQESGTGLGLILCKELVEKNGGRIWVESSEGQGSTFRFTVPLVQVAQ